MTDRPPRPSADPPPRPLDRHVGLATSGAAGAVVIASGDHQWAASAEGNGAIDALYRAVDKALAGVLTGHPRLLAYDIHALGRGHRHDRCGHGPDRAARRTTASAATGEYTGEARGANIIAASIEAYIQALNELLAEEHWSGATDAAGTASGAGVSAGDRARATGRDRRGRRRSTTRSPGSSGS